MQRRLPIHSRTEFDPRNAAELGFWDFWAQALRRLRGLTASTSWLLEVSHLLWEDQATWRSQKEENRKKEEEAGRWGGEGRRGEGEEKNWGTPDEMPSYFQAPTAITVNKPLRRSSWVSPQMTTASAIILQGKEPHSCTQSTHRNGRIKWLLF